jgi:hypothetical protein
MPFPPGYHPTPRGAPLDKAVADARWVVTNAEDTLHAVHTRIVDGLVGGLPYPLLEEAADAAVEARGDLVEGSEIIDQVALDTYDPEGGGHVGVVSDRDRADLEKGRERAWTAHLAGSAVIDRLDSAAEEQRHRPFLYFG